MSCLVGDLGVILRDDFSSLSRPSRKAIMISRKKMDTAIKFGFVKHQIHLEFQNFTDTLTKIHKPTPVGRPIVSGCDGPTEKLSSFVDKLLQAIVQQQKSYLKDITDFINYRENTKVPEDVILVSMNVTSLYTNIPQEEGIHMVCRAYETFYINNPNPNSFLHNY